MKFNPSVIASITLLSSISSMMAAPTKTAPCPESSVAPHVATTKAPHVASTTTPCPESSVAPHLETPTPIYEDEEDPKYDDTLPQTTEECEDEILEFNGGLKLTMSAIYGLAVLFVF